jgi:hypothetical protein
MRNTRTNTRGLALSVNLLAVAIAAGLQIQPANAQDTAASHAAVKPQTQATDKAVYYVDFRARTAASYGHAFVWYGRADQKQIEVAGLHPATESVVPYVLGHVIPVPSETGKSYGDLDEGYVTASYRVYMTEPEAKRVFAYIRRKQARSPLWNAATYNCIAFIQDIAREMGLEVPGNWLLYPEDWVKQLKQLNHGRRYMSSPAVAQAASAKPSASAQKPLAPANAQSAAASSASAQKPLAPANAQSAAAGGY